ncbi:MAG: site-specific DNA-methyltransferase [Deltaproteobacteria bacterium]|nr:site-specific DNA-methyltransferase [Deltaproteobacteria bacterium]
MSKTAAMLLYRQIIPTEGRVSESHASYVPNKSRPNRQLDFDLKEKVRNGNGFRDPAFSDNKIQPLHRWVPWIAGFSAQFVQDCFETFLKHRRKKPAPCVLDPFAGVGTTIVQAVLNGFNSIGFEINPYAALACKAKLNSPKLDLENLETYLQKYRRVAMNGRRHVGTLRPAQFETRIPFFSVSVEEQVLSFLDFVESIPQEEVADLFRVAFGSVMVSFSNYTYEPSLGSRPGAGKPLIDKADVHSTILGKLSEIVSDIRWVKERVGNSPTIGKGQVHNLDFLEPAEVLPPSSCDLMVTSPPYMNNYHYVRNTRPQLFWLSLVSSRKDLRKLEESNFGKYWQTVRDSEPLSLNFDHPELSRTLTKLRRTREEKGPYGGPGWANYVASYFNDCHRFCKALKRGLARGGVGVIVIGNSIIQGHEMKTDLILADIARQSGLALVAVQKIRTKRVGASITASTVRRGDISKATLYESAVILRKK